jgi:uncharacterized damage-inducible protein DinB
MPTMKELLLDHLKFTFAEESWQPPLSHAVSGLTAEQAAWTPAPDRHSIWQIVRHLLLWDRGMLQAWDGDPPDQTQMEEGDWTDARGDQVAWDRDVRALHDLYDDIRRRVESGEGADLDAARPWYQGGRPRSVASRILHMIAHDVYHTGQIQYLRALQGIPADRLFNAAEAGHPRIVAEVLRDHPNLVNAYNPAGWTALQFASYTGKEEVVRLLLERGADVNAVSQNELKWTALTAAERGGRHAVAVLLRERGAH